MTRYNSIDRTFRYVAKGACLPAYLPTCLPAYLPTCLPAYLPTCLPAYLPTCLPALTAMNLNESKKARQSGLIWPGP
jgi:hypothetical protein